MSDVGTEGRDLNADRGIRNHLEAAFAAARPTPDVDLIAQNVKELHDATHRARSDGKEVREFSDLRPEDRKRLAVRSAYTEERTKAANPQPKTGPQGAMHGTAPGTWSSESKALFNSLPDPVRRDVLREQNYTVNSLGRLANEYAEIKKAIDPHRNIIPPTMNEPQVIDRMFTWAKGLSSPDRNLRAAHFAQLMAQNGTTLQDVYDVLVQAQQGQQPQQYEQQQQYQQPDAGAQATYRTLAQFSQAHPDFVLGDATSVAMGKMLQANPDAFTGPDGETDLERVYQAVKQQHTSPDNQSKRAAAVSPSGRSPSAAPASTKHRSGIRGAIRDAIQEHRGNI